MKARVVIAGINGFVGKELQNMFTKLGYEVEGIKRDTYKDITALVQQINGSDIVINLAGANIIARWDEEYKQKLYNSRLDTTKALIKSFKECETKPKLFISTSAVGIYDNRSVYSEDDMNYAKDFLGNLCIDWEAQALRASELDIRTVIFRFGIVLGKNGGALQKMLLPFKLGLGGRIGSGKQGFSYIHIEDLLDAYKFVVEDENQDGIYNLVAPNPTTNQGLTDALGKALNRPTILPLPEFILEIIFSQGAKVLTDGQQIVPKRLLDAGFRFQYTTIQEAVNHLVKK